MKKISIVTIDLGGTKINLGLYRSGVIEQNIHKPFDARMSVKESIIFIKNCIDEIRSDDTKAIAIGVPSIVDVKQGVVFNAVNIKSWKKVMLKDDLQALTDLPVYVNNDVNCFVKGEHMLKVREGIQDMVGLCLGTGLGSGVILQNRLYEGRNGCAGEVGGIKYLTSTFDHYCSGKFFKAHSQECGSVLADKARSGDAEAMEVFEQFGQHLAEAIRNVLLIIDPQLIVLGGSVAKSFDLFIDSLTRNLADFPYQNVINNLVIEQSNQADSALLGAANLYLDSQKKQGYLIDR
jgi:glucokinase